MLKRLIILLVIIIVHSCDFISAEELQKIKIGIYGNEAPQSFEDEKGSPKGFTVDLSRALMDELNIKCEFAVYNRSRGNERNMSMVDSILKDCDLVISCIRSIDMERKYTLSLPYNSFVFNILSRQDQNYHGPHDLARKEILVKRGSSSQNELMKLGRNYFNNLIYVSDVHMGIKLLHEGIADYMICDEVAAKNFHNAILANKLVKYDSGFAPLELHFASENKQLISDLNVALLKLKMIGKYNDIHNKWFTVRDSIFDPTFLYWVLLATIITAVFFTLFIFAMRIQVKKAVSQSEKYQKDLTENIYVLETMKNSMPVGMTFFDKNGNLKDVNDGFCKFLCIEREKIMNDKVNLFELSHIPRYIKNSLHDGIESRFELRYEEFQSKMYKYLNNESPHGEIFDVRGVAFNDGDGEIQGYITIYNDITELNKDKQKIRLLQDSIDMALESGDLSTWIYDCSQDMFSLIKGDLLYEELFTGKVFSERLHEDDRDKMWNSINSIIERKTDKAALDFRYRVRGRWRWYSCSMVAMPSEGKIKYITGVRRDITDEVESAMALESYNIELERAKVKAEESERLKMAFLANMSHEIRTPLNAIVGFSEILLYSDTPDEREEYMKIIKINSELLLAIIDDILDLSKIESGMIDIKPEIFDIVDMFNKNFLSFESRCTKPDVKLICQTDLLHLDVLLDHNRVAQVFSNFMSNAVKYTEKGTITVSLEYEENGVRCSVSDTGIGVDDNKKHMIFKRFEKLDSFAQGTGLGLAISKAIVSALEGEIGFESKKGEGSLFWAWFPCDYYRAKRKKEKIKPEKEIETC